MQSRTDIKYSGRLFPVQVGQLISIVGKSTVNPHRIDVNLMTGNGAGKDSGDIQLHISVRFNSPEPVVIRNTHRKGVGWANEERREFLIMHNGILNPVRRGGDFRFDIFVDQAAFFITIDGKPYCTFNHRLSFNDIQMISVTKDVETIYQVNQTSSQYKTWPAIHERQFEAYAPSAFKPGNVIVITVIPRQNASGNFYVELYDGSNKRRAHLHIRPYLGNSNIVINSQNELEHWEHQIDVRPQPYPFRVNQRSIMAIAITRNEFQIAANGRRITSMPFRDQRKIFDNMTGVGIICDNGTKLDVQGVEFKYLEPNCGGFENFTKV